MDQRDGKGVISVKYVYFLSYVYVEDNKLSFADGEAQVENEIKNLGDLNEIAKAIAESRGYNHNTTILSFQLLRKEV